MMHVLLLWSVVIGAFWLPYTALSQNAEHGSGQEDVGVPVADEFMEDFGELVTFETEVTAPVLADTAGERRFDATELSQEHVGSADELLAVVPGLHIVQHGAEGKGHQLFLRGFDAAHGSDVEVLMAGVGLNEPSFVHGNGYVDLYGIIPEVVSEMHVSKGVFLAGQGNFATAGTVRFELAAPAALKTALVKTAVNIHGKARGVVVVAPTNVDRFVAAEVVYDVGFAENREGQRAAFLSQYRTRKKKGRYWEAVLSMQTARFETPGTMSLADYQQGDVDFYDSHGPGGDGGSDRLLGKLGWFLEQGAVSLDVSLYGAMRQFSLTENFTGWLLYPEHGDRRNQRQRGAMAGLNAGLTYPFDTATPLSLVFGSGWRFDGLHQVEQQVNVDGTPWQTNRQHRIGIGHGHFHAGVKWLPWCWLQLQPSVRWDVAPSQVSDELNHLEGTQTVNAISPRMTIGLPVNEMWQFFVGVGRGFRFPEARSVLAQAEQSDEPLSQYDGGQPRVFYADTIEGGLRLVTVPQLDIRFLGFGVWMENEMVFDHVSNLNLERNSTARLGSEIDISFVPASWVRVGASVTAVNARFRDSGNRVPGVPVLMGQGKLFLGKSRGLYSGVATNWIGKRYLAHGASVSGYVDVNAHVGWRFSVWDICLAGENLLNVSKMEGAYHFAAWFDRSEPRSQIPQIQYAAGEPLTLQLLLTLYL